MPKTQDNLFAAVELGSSSVKVLIAQQCEDTDEMDILGAARIDSLKIVKGEIVNVKMVEEKLRDAITKAEEESGVDIRDAFVALTVSGSYISQGTVKADVLTANADKTITQEDVNRAIANARQKDISSKDEILNTSIRFHTLSDGRQVLDPLGIISESLQTSILLIKAQKANLATPVKLLGGVLDRDVNDLCYTPLMLGQACLNADAVKGQGHVLIDIGAGVTSCALFTAAGCHTAFQITVGTEQAANDLSIAFQLPIQYARNLLEHFGNYGLNLNSAPADDMRQFDITQGPGMPKRRIAAKAILQVVVLRFVELFDIIQARIQGADGWRFGDGDIMLSGGAVGLPGLLELAQSVFRQNTLVAKPFGFHGPAGVIDNPAFVAPLGALRNAKHALDIYNYQKQGESGHENTATKRFCSILKNLLNF